MTNVNFDRHQKHVDCTESRMKQDAKDLVKLKTFLEDRNPFVDPENGPEAPLRNIYNGLVADENVNAYDAKSVGVAILNSLEGKSIDDTTLQKKSQVVTMASKSSIKIGDDVVHIDQQLLFQRLTVTARKTAVDVKEVFKYELCSYPPALFDDSGVMLSSNKAALADGLWNKYMSSTSTMLPIRPHYVIDGGSLLYRISWPKSVSYSDIIDMYCDYVIRKYGHATVVFDGYDGTPSTKDSAHARRRGDKTHLKMKFSLDMIVPAKKDSIFHNDKLSQVS